jgi:hypothetical protein
MTSGKYKYQSREIRSALNNLLLRYWDPIGVRDIVGAEDEYRAYAAKIYVMMGEPNFSRDDLVKYLYQTATGHMGLAATPDLMQRSIETADRIFETKGQLLLH